MVNDTDYRTTPKEYFDTLKVANSATVTGNDLLQNNRGCVYWWEKMICQVWIFSKKPFFIYGIFRYLKTHWLNTGGVAEFPNTAKFQKTHSFVNIFFSSLKSMYAKDFYFILMPKHQGITQFFPSTTEWWWMVYSLGMLVLFHYFLETLLSNFVNFYRKNYMFNLHK